VCTTMLKIIVTIISIILIPIMSDAKDLSKSIAYALQTKIKLIAIDAGFGGKKTGPSGCDGTVFAKTINLQIAKKVAKRINDELEINVILTRSTDKDISLEERTNIANTNNADLLISIHTNGSEYSSASGIETYMLNLGTDDEVITMAAIANEANPKNIVELDSIIQDLMQNSKVRESDQLAKNIQKCLINQLGVINTNLRNRGVKQAPFYILIGADMPAIIIQAGFVTNPAECKLLKSDEYQEEISIGIANGINAFKKERFTQPVNSANPKGRAAD
jgi:N-acetylmuramoyl-L-alanine amidase